MKTTTQSDASEIIGNKARLKSLLCVIARLIRGSFRLTNWIAGFCIAIGLSVAAWQLDPRSDETNIVGLFDDPRSGVWWTMWDAHHLKRSLVIMYPSGTEEYADLLSKPRRAKGYTIVDGVAGSYRYQTPDRQIPWWAWNATKPQAFLTNGMDPDARLILLEDAVGWPYPFAIRAYPESGATRVSEWLVSIDRWPHVLNVNYGLWKIRLVSLLISCALFSLCVSLIRLVFASMRRWRRTSKGRCGNCGYSLEGLRDGLCPECGTTSDQVVCSA
jgi:hypothetical protein